MARRRGNGKKPPRYKEKKYRLRELLPRVGFDFTDKRCRKMLSSVDSVIIKEQIRARVGELNKAKVDEALAIIFEQAMKVLEEDIDKVTELMAEEFWSNVKQNIPWATEGLPNRTFLSLVITLIVAHEKYSSYAPHANFKHQYGKLATTAHDFAFLLKQVSQQHNQSNPFLTKFYLNSSMWGSSDGKDEDTEAEEDPVEEPRVDSPPGNLADHPTVGWLRPKFSYTY
ncbi:hypothetical protein F4818DRAFT_443839 [Hypoxylon cercidicola]|nr:hypothetical protein F4818DRAFT_443839 [Hypoxylon cercidicola]